MNKDQRYILIVLTLINFFNYLDRQVIFPLFGHIKADFGVTDFELGLLGTVFMLVHSLASLPLGLAADKYSRKKIIGLGVLFWSAASFTSGLARSFYQLLFVRGAVGIGEAAYAPAATAMISDNFPEEKRASMQSWFNSGMFIGGTLGAMIGGIIGFYFNNWRLAFFLVSIPGIILALSCFSLKDQRLESTHENLKPLELLKVPAYFWLLVGGTLSTFASGAYISWGVEFVARFKGYNLRDASLILGITMMLAGVVGVFLGGFFADWLHKKHAWGRSITVAASQLLAVPFMFLGLAAGRGLWFLLFFFVGVVFLSFYYGPATAVMHDTVPQRLWATAFAVYILVIHLLGDTLAPAVIGRISDTYNLLVGLQVATVFVGLAGVAFLVMAKHVGNRDQEA